MYTWMQFMEWYSNRFIFKLKIGRTTDLSLLRELALDVIDDSSKLHRHAITRLPGRLRCPSVFTNWTRDRVILPV